MSDSEASINCTSLVDAAKYEQSGWKSNSVRLKEGKKSIGFATTAYSYAFSDEVKVYAAERIVLLMTLSKGLTNDDIRKLNDRLKRG